MGVWPGLVAQFRRRQGLVTSLSFAAANFLLVFALQLTSTPAEFGAFALAQVLLNLGLSLSNALFASPLVVALARGAGLATLRSFAVVNLLYCVGGAVAFAAIVRSFDVSTQFVVTMSAVALLLWFRWFFRSVELADGRFGVPAAVDLVYAAVVGPAALLLIVLGRLSIETAAVTMLVGAGSGFLVLAPRVGQLMRGLFNAQLRGFKDAFRSHAGWALIGVIATEVTSNAYAYLVGFLSGPEAYAPIAAVAIFLKPTQVLAQSMTQYERPRLARFSAASEVAELDRALRGFSRVLAGFFTLNVIGLALLIASAPNVIGGGTYAQSYLIGIATLLCINLMVAVAQTGPGAALQASGLFRRLARIGVIAGATTLISSMLIVLAVPNVAPLLILGVFMGQLVTFVLIGRGVRQLRTSLVRAGA